MKRSFIKEIYEFPTNCVIYSLKSNVNMALDINMKNSIDPHEDSWL